jgi:hypothetical protein
VADEKLPWERRPKEPSKAHDAFRTFRDQGAGERSITAAAAAVKMSEVQVRRWASAWDWWERASLWDDEVRRAEDEERLTSVREMAELYRKTGKAALEKAMDALAVMPAEEIPAAAMVRLLEFGVKMQRTLIAEDEADESEDPWEAIARELDPRSIT